MNHWPKIVLGDVLQRSNEISTLSIEQDYHEITVKLWGKGVVSRGKVQGSDVVTTRRFVRAGQLILSKIDARSGAIGIVPVELDGAIVSNDFPSFHIDNNQILPEFLGWLVRSTPFVELCKASSEGTTNRVRIKEDRFLNQTIAFPTITEQQTIVTRLDAVAEKIQQVEAKLDEIETDAEHLLSIQFRETIEGADWRSMAEVAPLVRREVEIDFEGIYPELGIRSFGKGTFHKPPLSGADVGSKRLFGIEPGDLIFSNVFAWEGAIAVVRANDTGRFGSHRFITCDVNPNITSPEFLRYYFLTPEGMEKIGTASPGGAGRNRTLGLGKLMAIQVPVPEICKQQAFDTLQTKFADMKAKHKAIRLEIKVLLPSMLERIFTPSANNHD